MSGNECAIPITPPISGKMPISILTVVVPVRICGVAVIAVRPMRSRVVRSRFVMKAQEIHAVIVAVGCPHDGMDVEFLRLRIIQHDALMVIELDHHHRTLKDHKQQKALSSPMPPAQQKWVSERCRSTLSIRA